MDKDRLISNEDNSNKPPEGLTKIRDFLGKFSYINIFHYASMACYYPFIVGFLTKRGYTSTEIGIILTINSIVAIIAQPLWGFASDKMRSVRKVYASLAVVISFTVPFVTLINNYFIHLIYIPLCIIFFYCPFNALLDAWIVQGIKNLPGKTYGSIRLWGSVGYMITTAIMGFIATRIKIEAVFILFSFFMLVNALIAFSIRDEGVPQIKDDSAEDKNERKPFKDLLKNYQYMSFVVCMFVLHLPLTLKYGFMAPRIYLAGGSDFIFGLGQSASALVEIPVFLYASRYLKKFKPQQLILLSMGIYLFHFFCISLPIPPWMFILLNCINGLGYSLFLVASVSYIDALSPLEFKTSALTFATGVYGSASGIIGNFVSGIIIDSIGLINTFWYGVVFVAFSILLFAVSLMIGNRKYSNAVDYV